MERLLFVLLPAVAFGCVTFSTSHAPTDRDCRLVDGALDGVLPGSFERHVRGDDWTMRPATSGRSGSTGPDGHEVRWHASITCLPRGEDRLHGKVFRLPPEDYVRVLTPIRDDVIGAVERCGVTVTSAGPVEFQSGPEPQARFVIRYQRKDGAVAGEVTGSLAPGLVEGEPDKLSSDLAVTLHERVVR